MATATERAAIRTTGIHHAAIRCSDLRRARVFYLERLGFPLLSDGTGEFTFAVGASAVRVLAPADPAATDGSDGQRAGGTGLHRIALGCPDARELRRAAAALTSAGIEHSGVGVDEALGGEQLTFDDPDGIGWALYVIDVSGRTHSTLEVS